MLQSPMIIINALQQQLPRYAQEWNQQRKQQNMTATWDEFIEHCTNKTTLNKALLEYFFENFTSPKLPKEKRAGKNEVAMVWYQYQQYQ
eukprot:scaffold526_cov159-Amphora_coffeaeformis.AAC.4